MIEVKNLTKRYGDHLALDDISFTVGDGEIVGFLGPNGAGKSTTMNIMTGYVYAVIIAFVGLTVVKIRDKLALEKNAKLKAQREKEQEKKINEIIQ